MAEANADKERSCGYCNLNIERMNDPRELQCEHVHCSDCLKGKYNEESNGVFCNDCQDYYQMKVFKAKIPAVKCAHGKCENDAISVCPQCNNKRLCETHQQTHNEFCVNHEVEMIDKTHYMEDQGCCDTHNNQSITSICKLCNALFCQSCNTTGKQCNESGTQHQCATPSVMDEEVTSHFNELLQSTDAKLKEFSTDKRNCGLTVDDVERKCKEWKKEIDECRAKLVEEINSKCDGLVQTIDHYLLKEVHGQVGSFNAKKEALEESRSKISKLMTCSVVEKIKQKDLMEEELQENLTANLDSCVVTEKTFLLSRESAILDAHIISLPQSLEHHSTVSSGDNPCHSAFNRDDGHSLVGCDQGVMILDHTCKTCVLTKAKGLQYRPVTSIVEHRHAVYVLHKNKGAFNVEMCTLDLKHLRNLHRLARTIVSATYLAVSDSYTVVSAKENNSPIMVIGDLKENKVYTIEHDMRCCFFLPDGCLLVGENSRLAKYRLGQGLKVVWAIDRLKDIRSICADNRGLIFAAVHGQTSSDAGQIHLISPQGELLTTLTNEQLPGKNLGQMSIYGEELLIPGGEDRNLYIFKIR